MKPIFILLLIMCVSGCKEKTAREALMPVPETVLEKKYEPVSVVKPTKDKEKEKK